MTLIECESNDFSREQREQVEWFAKQSIYAVIDACNATDLVCKLREQLGFAPRMLFQGPAATDPDVEEVAPHVYFLDSRRDFLRQWIERLGFNAGILIASDVSFEVIHKHLRKIFIVKDTMSQEYFFRFYDPRVVRGFLPACRPGELEQFFGPIRGIFVEDFEPKNLIFYTQLDGVLVTKRFSVSRFCELLD